MDLTLHAISDATRRDLLTRLRTSGPLSVSELATPLPMSRQAVTKHLDVLEQAGLVERQHRGRERLHTARAEPLRDVVDWLTPWEEEWDDRLTKLKKHLDGE